MDVGNTSDRGQKSWSMVFAPETDARFQGESVNQGVIFSPNLKFTHDFSLKIDGGMEYHGSGGPVTGFDAVSQQQQQISTRD
jgi:hypothetical protein